MAKLLTKLFKIYKGELGLLLFCAALSFIIRSSSILFTNFAETAFLKRYGVEFLPVVMAANSILTFVLMAFMTGIMARISGSRLLAYLFLFSGTSVAALRFAIPLGIDLLYPLFYILKAQYEALLALVFWNLANDLFNTRQSKRLFPLITAGGVVGGIIGSFATPPLARTITPDNLLLAYLAVSLVGAALATRAGSHFPTHLLAERTDTKKGRRPSVVDEFKRVIPIIKESKLVRVLIILTLLPNIALQLMNYMFNFAIDQHYASESGMLQFFGYFRGSLNVISLVLLLFVGRIYARWGLSIALMFHPVNYLIAFLTFLLSFDVVAAMYARISTRVLLTTIHNPAKAVLTGLVPASDRGVIRPFLRGTVVRAGVLLGAGFIIVAGPHMHPRYFSIAGMCIVGAWIVGTLYLKRHYSSILFDLISKNMLDLKSLEDVDAGQVFADKKVRSTLTRAFLSARGDECLWYARLQKTIGAEELDSNILAVLNERDDKTKIGLLDLLSARAGRKAVPLLRQLAAGAGADISVAVIKAFRRVEPELSTEFDAELFDTHPDPRVKAYAVAGLYRRSPQKYRERIDTWLTSGNVAERTAGAIAAGESGDPRFTQQLKGMLAEPQDVSVISALLRGLSNLGIPTPEMNSLAKPYLSYPDESVRLAALETVQIEGDDNLQAVIPLMGDDSDQIHELARNKLHSASYHNAQLLVEALVLPSAKLREGIFFLLESLKIGDADALRFAQFQVERAYKSLAEVQAVLDFPESSERALLVDHLTYKKSVRLDNLLRGLATQDQSGKLRLIWRGLSSTDPRERANALEAFEDSVHPPLAKIMIPLLEDHPLSVCLAIGRKSFELPDPGTDPMVLSRYLLTRHDWKTVVLTLYLLARHGDIAFDRSAVEELSRSENEHIRKMADIVLRGPQSPREKEAPLADEITVPEKILHLKRIYIFEDLSVTELAAIASVTEDVVYPPGEIVIKEGERGDTMYLILKGKVSVLKSAEGGSGNPDIELGQIGERDYFGEMALFEDTPRSATIRTDEQTTLLVLHKRELTEIVREHPKIALNICGVLSGRLRELHEKLKEC